jgi:MFS transporter, DHA2 family, multidrug resistance protein
VPSSGGSGHRGPREHWHAVYRSQVADSFREGVPPEAAEAVRDTLVGAAATARELPDPLGAALLDAAHEAFTQGLQLTAIASAAIVLGMAILCMVLLRHVRTGSEPEDRTDTAPTGAVAGEAGIEKALGRAAEVPDDCAPGIEES